MSTEHHGKLDHSMGGPTEEYLKLTYGTRVDKYYLYLSCPLFCSYWVVLSVENRANIFFEIHTYEVHVESTLQGSAILISFLVSAVFHEVLQYCTSLRVQHYMHLVIISLVFLSQERKMAWFHVIIE